MPIFRGWPYRNFPNTQFILNRASLQARGLVRWWVPLGSRANFARELVIGDRATFDNGAAWSNNLALGRMLNTATAGATAGGLCDPAADSISVAVWANWLGDNGNYQGIVAKRTAWGSTQMRWQIATDIGNPTNIQWRSQSSVAAFSNSLSAGLHHYVITQDATEARLYVDGALFGSMPAITFASGPAAVIRIGETEAASEVFNGSIGDVRIYNRVLSIADVRALYAPQTRWDLYQSLATQTQNFFSSGSSATNITVAEGTQSQTGDSVTVRAITGISVAEGAQAQLGDAVTVRAITGIVVAEGSQSQLGDAVTVRGITGITIARGNQTQTGDAVTIRALTPLAVAEGNQSQTMDAVVVSFGSITNLTVAEGTQSQTQDAVNVSALTPLVVAEGNQAQTGDPVSISFSGIGVTNITVAEGSQVQAGDAVVVGAITPIIVARGNQAQTGDAVTVTGFVPGWTITVAEGTQAQTGDAVILRAIYPLIVAEGAQSQSMDAVSVILGNLILHGNRQLYPAGIRANLNASTRVTHPVSTRVTLEVDDD